MLLLFNLSKNVKQGLSHTGCPKKVLVFDQQQNKGLLFGFHFFSILSKAYPKLDFETKILEIR